MHFPSELLPVLKSHPLFPVTKTKKKIEDIQDQMQFFLLPSNKKRERNSQIIQFSCSVVSDSFRPHGLQDTRLSYPLPSPRACSNSGPLSWWCHPVISFSVSPFSFCPQSSPASRSLPMSVLFASGGHSIEVSASASVLPMNIQGWFPVGWTGLISLICEGLSKVFSSTTVWKHQFFGTQPSLWSSSHICTWLLVKP